MHYALIITFAAGLFGGAGIMHRLEQAEIVRLRAAIKEGNIEASRTLSEVVARVKQAELQAEQANQQLQTSYDQNIHTINAYFDRLRARRAAGHPDAVPGCERAAASATDAADFAQTAYQLEAYANSCWQFVSRDCGTQPQGPQ